MPRIARGLADGHFYHISNRGNCRQEVFHTREDYAAFAGLTKESVRYMRVDNFSCKTYCHFYKRR
jgi:hypothetical protein